MTSSHDPGSLHHIPTHKVRTNPDNPRLNFRQGELEDLQESIRRYGIQVPVAVYKSGNEYVLIDGERRWRCASKLNLKTIPALIQKEPTRLENLLLMFNIHALREQWDLLTIALKLPAIVELLKKETGQLPTEIDLSIRTGLTRSVIRRCRLLMDLPKKYKDMLLEELKKPKSKQQLSEDLFIEMERSLKTIARALPDSLPDKDSAREMLLRKYREDVIDNVVDFRKVAKIARASSVGVSAERARGAIGRLLREPRYSIKQAYEDTVSEAYVERDVLTRIDQLMSKLAEIDPAEIDDEVRERLEDLILRVRVLLKGSA
jgi:ParB family transcriptional regulator, chromosome partitioning protein